MSAAVTVHELAPRTEDIFSEVLTGLRATPKRLPCKLLYDERGSELFERICELEEYYPTRTELAIMERHAASMASAVGPKRLLIELGSGSSLKTRRLLDHLDGPAGYVPIDISRDALEAAAAALREEYPDLPIHPVWADYTRPISLPVDPKAVGRAVYFPGSTVGNFHRPEAVAFLRRIAKLCEPGGKLLIGVDMVKDRHTLERAYDDDEGVTAAFNLNMLSHVNERCGGNFDLRNFEHRAFFNEAQSRIEMHLVSLRDHTVRLRGHRIGFAKGETIHTESSYKYTRDSFARLANDAGFSVTCVWTDDAEWFSVHLLTAR